MAPEGSGRIVIYLVTGEYCFSENGEVGWPVGVFRSQASAREAARDAADAEEDRRRVVDGKAYGGNWGCACAAPDHARGCSADLCDWEVRFEVQTMDLED